MLCSILVGLDGSACSQSAVQLGIDWAKDADALLVGLAIVDEPTIAASVPRVLGTPSYAEPLVYEERMADARQQSRHLLDQFADRCSWAGVAHEVLLVTGIPCEQILREAQRYDVILLGQKTRFHYEISETHDDTLARVLKNSPRPVVVVPETEAEGQSVIIAYDGSLQAARVLFAFRDLGLERGRAVHVLSVHRDVKEAACLADLAGDFLGLHAVRAELHALASSRDPGEVILEQLRELDAGLVVMGAYGKPVLTELLLGSATRSLLKNSPVPLFLFH